MFIQLTNGYLSISTVTVEENISKQVYRTGDHQKLYNKYLALS